jgi:hypothetical protein
VKVHRRGFGKLVLEYHAHAIAFTNADLWTGNLPVVGPSLDHYSGRRLPAKLFRRQLVDFHRAIHPRLHQLVSLSRGLGGKGFYACFVHLVHLLGGRSRRNRRGIRRHGAATVVGTTGVWGLSFGFVDRTCGQRSPRDCGNGGVSQEITARTLLTE